MENLRILCVITHQLGESAEDLVSVRLKDGMAIEHELGDEQAAVNVELGLLQPDEKLREEKSEAVKECAQHKLMRAHIHTYTHAYN